MEDAIWLNNLRSFEKAQAQVDGGRGTYERGRLRAQEALARADAFRDMRRAA